MQCEQDSTRADLGQTQVVGADGKARVVFVAEGGPAQRGGLAVGDTVVALNGKPVNLAQKQ